MITPRQAVLAAAATYDGGRPNWQSPGGALSVFMTEVGGEIVISNEGTHNDFGWAIDFDAWPVAAKDPVTHGSLPAMHAGFYDVILPVLPGIRDAVKGRKYSIGGHSLGGAAALGEAAMLADEGNPPQAVYLFAPARVFLDAPDVLAGVPIFGWRCGGDIVPMMPPWCWRPILTHFAGPADETSHAIGNFVGFIK